MGNKDLIKVIKERLKDLKLPNKTRIFVEKEIDEAVKVYNSGIRAK